MNNLVEAEFQLGYVCILNHFSHVTLCDPMDCSLPGSSVHGFSRQKHWSGLPCPPPRDLPNPGTEPVSPVAPALQAESSPLSDQVSPKGPVVESLPKGGGY